MDNWDEIRTAFHVAKQGTVSGAAEMLGVHHATVIRHIDALEGRLGTKLFQRHARGYTATEAGKDLLRVAQATDEQFAQLGARLRGTGDAVAGELVVTAIPGLALVLAPVLAEFQMDHPDVRVRLMTDVRVFRLEYGEAHVALRVGMSAPDEPDNVVQSLAPLRSALYASQDYIDRTGFPETDEDLLSRSFVGSLGVSSRAPFHVWMDSVVPPEQILFSASDFESTKYAVLAGIGLGFISTWEAAKLPQLVQVRPPRPDWTVNIWLVTHVDLHRTPKVQAIVNRIKAKAVDWPDS
ncbi:LysR family transcriptional regulator [Pseudoruegeria sp. SK021]|uniref:LysR family transcriptional regulator n=1 Tax=Pseudoruegeria sp. SK021 TaxID=1933035 RepID=UPI000A25C21C|nr:LysR family transcriptional regulator [Pseudoruegeria sp. SK021]OSP56588.1 LysR family transcriptional regulator [Pseudoruegeria sp. SK021]